MSSNKKSGAKAVKKVAKIESRDRSSFNCQPCAGLGLLPNGNVCVECKGKGKI